MAQAYVPIQTVTLSATTASIEFTNIPQNYTDLLAVFSIRTDAANTNRALELRVNSGTSNQSSFTMYGDGSSSGSASYGSAIYANMTIPGSSATSSTFSNISIYISNYTSSNYKPISIDAVSENNGVSGAALACGLYSSSTVISSLLVLPESTGSLVQHSTATLYGIGGARASGGTITADARYTYHTFTSTGTFTALEKIKGAEVLCIAGGGGGGKNFGGGGGAGGLLYSSGQLLTAGNSYTVLVGSGGTGHTATWTPIATNGSNSSFGSNIAIGGGYGGGYNGSAYFGGGSGGSGGGGSYESSGGSPTSGQGNTGGAGGSNAPGGGGGAGAVGAAASGGNGGNGGSGSSTYSSWGYATSTGQLSGGIYYYAGGGGGGSGSGTAGTAGLGGGGGGGQSSGVGSGVAGSAATANTGGGGGGGSWYSGNGANGGSGLVIIRYPN